MVLYQGQEIQPEDLPEELRKLPDPIAIVPPEPPSFSHEGGPGGSPSAGYGANTGLGANADYNHNGSPEDAPRGWGSKPTEAMEAVEEKAWTRELLTALPSGIPLVVALDALEEGLIRRALAQGEGVQSRAAEILGLKRNVFKY
ncbi:MAG: hypothetical protein LBS60_04675 [Deltaproteobacteria bacterium]|nr:hypothetical protein [Deltaproteobacteria bacterium]